MKLSALLLLFSSLASALSCKHASDISPTDTSVQHPWISQVDVSLGDEPIHCLLNQWYARAYSQEPILFRVVNDTSAYNAFFPCQAKGSLPSIDFTTRTLLIGMKADYGQFINTPVNISTITQQLIPAGKDDVTFQVSVTGEASKAMAGSEWFVFATVVPKIKGTVKLDMQYQFK